MKGRDPLCRTPPRRESQRDARPHGNGRRPGRLIVAQTVHVGMGSPPPRPPTSHRIVGSLRVGLRDYWFPASCAFRLLAAAYPYGAEGVKLTSLLSGTASLWLPRTEPRGDPLELCAQAIRMRQLPVNDQVNNRGLFKR